jgi:hypothetical protein
MNGHPKAHESPPLSKFRATFDAALTTATQTVDQMTALARNLHSFAPGTQARSSDHDSVIAQLSLRPDGERCALVTADGQVVFKGFGTDARRECLRFAQRLGALTLRR